MIAKSIKKPLCSRKGFMRTRHISTQQCNAFLREEMEQFSKKHSQENEVVQRLREYEIQRAREAETRANAAMNHEVSVSQERYLPQQEVQHLRKEAYQLRRQQEASVAEAQQAADELAVHRRRHRQFEDNMAKDMQQGASEMTGQIDAMWRQEHQMEMSRWEQECRQLRLESQSAHVYLLDRGRQDNERELHYQEQAIVLQSETASLVQEQQAMMSEQQAARLAGLRAREMETHAHKQIVELDQREACMQQNWQLMQQECATLIRDKESLMQNLIVCQDMIREEAQAHQQQQRQLLEQVQTPQLVDDPHALPGRSELWGTTVGEALMGRDGKAVLPGDKCCRSS